MSPLAQLAELFINSSTPQREAGLGQQRSTAIQTVILWLVQALVLTASLVGGQTFEYMLPILIWVNVVPISALLLLRRTGNARLATSVAGVGCLLSTTALAFVTGGLRSPWLPIFVIFPAQAFVLAGVRGVLLIAVLTSLMIGFLIGAESIGILPVVGDTSLTSPYLHFLGILYPLTLLTINTMNNEARRANTLRTLERSIEEARQQARALAESRTQMAELAEKAEASSHSKSLFLAMMSHELRTPMTGVLGMVDLLELTPLNPDQRELLEGVRSSAGSLLNIVNDVLDFSKIEADKLQLQPAPFETERLVKDMVTLFSGPAKMRGLSLESHLEGRVSPRVEGDSLRLRQVLGNLLSNALKFTEKGGVVLRTWTAPGEEGWEQLWFSVQDTGTGMTPDQLSAIFEPFVQASGQVERRFGGTGLGLTICRKLVQAMGGEITVESRPLGGSIFTFWVRVRTLEEPELSLAEQSISKREPLVPPPPEKPVSRRILVVEDNLVNQRLLQRMLERQGHHVKLVDNGLQAIGTVQSQPFDVVLMDVQMPVLNGLEATRQIRLLGGALEHLPIYALSADAREPEKQQAREAGMNGYLTKPFQWDQIFAVLASLEHADASTPMPSASSSP